MAESFLRSRESLQEERVVERHGEANHHSGTLARLVHVGTKDGSLMVGFFKEISIVGWRVMGMVNGKNFRKFPSQRVPLFARQESWLSVNKVLHAGGVVELV